jgi:hypothetical protein
MSDEDKRVQANPEIQALVRARLRAARAAKVSLLEVARTAGLSDSIVFGIASPQGRGMIASTAKKILETLDKLGAPAAGSAPSSTTAPATTPTPSPTEDRTAAGRRFGPGSITRAEADTLRPLVQKVFDDERAKAGATGARGAGRRQAQRRLGLTDGSTRQFLGGRGLRHETAQKVWAGLGIQRPPQFAATMPPDLKRPRQMGRPRKAAATAPAATKAAYSFQGGASSPKLPPELIQEIKRFSREAVIDRHVCTVEELCKATLYSRQGLFTMWSAETNRPIRPEGAAAILRYLEKRGARGAKTLLGKLAASGALNGTPAKVHASAPGTSPGARLNYVESARVRDLLAKALPSFGTLPKLASHVELTAHKTQKILNGSTMTRDIADRITSRLGAATAMIPAAPAQLSLAFDGSTPPPPAELAPADANAFGEAANRLAAQWGRQALELVLTFTRKP